MASSTEEHDVVPIFLLPDELLMEIFSYITFIREKIDLERVSKRIQYVSSRPQSWKGIHKLKMEIDDIRGYVCVTDPITKLNDIVSLPLVKWPAAIQSLLDRTHINELEFHLWSNNKLDHALFSSITQVFDQNRHKMKLKILKWRYQSKVNQLCWNLIRLLHISVPYLEEFKLIACDMKDIAIRCLTAEIWPVVNKCISLKSFSFDCDQLSVDWTALIGKPLTQLIVNGARRVPRNNGFDNWIQLINKVKKVTDGFDNLIQVINNAKGEGIQKLDISGLDLIPENNPQPFKYFCDQLDETARKKLGDIRGYRVKVDEISHLYLVPSIFPNLECIGIKLHDWAAIDIDQFCIMAVSFLNLAHSQSSNCTMDFTSLTVEGGNTMQLKENLLIACQNDGITVQFYDDTKVLLSKGNASIKIRCIDEFEQIDYEDDENFE